MDTNMELPDSDKRLQTVDIEDKLIKGDFTAQELLLIMDEILVREVRNVTTTKVQRLLVLIISNNSYILYR